MNEEKTDTALRLNIGAGSVAIEGFTSIDRKNGDEAYPLKYEDESVDEIRASHVLEHFYTSDLYSVLSDWVRVLKPGGKIKLAVPSFAHVAEQYHRNTGDSNLLFAYVMGGATDDNDHHHAIFDEPRLRVLMRMCNLDQIQPWVSDVLDCARLAVSLNLEGVKPFPRKEVVRPATVACMSTSRLGFTEHMFCATQVFVPRDINIIKATGVFWGQCLERIMSDAIASGVEWIVTMDYDTVFTGEMFDELCYLMATHPEADAIAPWQVKRECDDPLCWFTGKDGIRRGEIPLTELDCPLTKVDSAHFGLTLFRVSALKKMEHPWFLATPSKDGTWGENHIDEDIHFWHKWRDTGNSLFLANRVSIGHLQHMVTWPDKSYRAQHQYVTDFQKHGMPGYTER